MSKGYTVTTTNGRITFSFSAQTPALARDLLRANGWRFNRQSKVWTRHDCEAAREAAANLQKLLA